MLTKYSFNAFDHIGNGDVDVESLAARPKGWNGPLVPVLSPPPKKPVAAKPAGRKARKARRAKV